MLNRDDITAAMKMMGDETAKEVSPAIAKAIENMHRNNMLPRDAFGMDPKTVEATYALAYHHYNSGQYVEAARLFQLLQLLDGTEPKFTLGLAACFQMLEEYQNALVMYGMAEMINPLDPVPHYHASDCYIKMDVPGAAVAELQMAVELCGTDPQYKTIKERSQMMISSLQDKINQMKSRAQKEK